MTKQAILMWELVGRDGVRRRLYRLTEPYTAWRSTTSWLLVATYNRDHRLTSLRLSNEDGGHGPWVNAGATAKEALAELDYEEVIP